ncbi:MAG: hypothetical protein R3A80_01545 [Bdellovibrionota bacterium]
MKTLNIIILGLSVALAACSKKTSGDNSAYVDPYAPTYQQPGYQQPGYNNCTQGSYNCNTQPQIPTTNCGSSCGNSGGGYIVNNDEWWVGYNDNNSGSSNGGGSSSNNYSSGWKKMWGTMGSSENRYIDLKVPSDKTYYVSFKGSYTGKNQSKEKLKVKFYQGNTHSIMDLDQSHTGSGEITKSCKVNVNFKLKGGSTYRIYLSGNQDSVNNTYLRLTSYWPSDVTKLCN